MEIDSIETRIDNIEILEDLLEYAKECASDREEFPPCIKKAEKIIDKMRQ